MAYSPSSSSSSQFNVAAVLKIPSFLFFIFVSYGASAVTFNFVNECGFTVWPGILEFVGSPGFNSTGFELTKGNSRSFQAPAVWEGRFWGRTGCNFSFPGNGSCATGDCGTGVIDCNGSGYTPPATIVEFSINRTQRQDLYDVSIVDGYNLPILVEAIGGSGSGLRSCAKTGCVVDLKLNQRCPPELSVSNGGACNSACSAFGSPEYCCSGSFSTPSTCKPTRYALLFESACPRAFSTAFDDHTSIFMCNGADYTIRFCPSADSFSTVKQGGQLNSTDQLVSIGGNFTLGFFGVDYSYLGIWYINDVKPTKVWVANPNAPIVSTSGTHALSINPNTGDLIITAGGRILMSITDVKIGPNSNVTATLEDDGNFRLINEIDRRVLWQSFDHPTNVLLPGMKLGYNLRTGQNWTLTSWLSDEIPDPGVFTLSWEPTEEASQRLMIRRRGKPYWTSGNLNNQTFQYMFGLNGPSSQYRYNFTFLYNNIAHYFTYKGSNSALPMWILTPNGQIGDINNATFWTPEFCYGYDSGNGCERFSLPDCRRENDHFSLRKGDFASNMTRKAIDLNSSLSISDCFVKCWNNCNCVGFNSYTINGTGCAIWTGSNRFLVSPHENSTSIYVISQNPTNPSTGSKTKKIKSWVCIFFSVGILLLLICCGLLWYIKKRKRKRKEHERLKRDEYWERK